jgi:hypothetical protein
MGIGRNIEAGIAIAMAAMVVKGYMEKKEEKKRNQQT